MQLMGGTRLLAEVREALKVLLEEAVERRASLGGPEAHLVVPRDAGGAHTTESGSSGRTSG